MAVAIFGATSRIAQQLAHRYAERGHAVYVAGRDADELARIARDVHVRCRVPVASGVFDVRDSETHGALVARIEEAVGELAIAVVACGAMGDQARSQSDPAAAGDVIAVNFTGAAALCEALAAVMTPRGAGTIIGIGSVAGDRGRETNYVYGSAKGAFSLYLQGLRSRLFRAGVHVMTVKLGFVDTRMTYGLRTRIPVASPERASAAIVAAADRRRDLLYYPPFWRGVMGVIRGIPERAFKRLSL